MASVRPARARKKRQRRSGVRRVPIVPSQKHLYSADDHGRAVVINPENFAPTQRDGGWGPFCEPFLRTNEAALSALDVRAELGASSDGATIRLIPGGRTGAIPLRSAQTGHIAAGFVVKPRFGWSGVGQVLSETGWHASPQFLDFPLVPGSGREVPPWVLAGPVLFRLKALLQSLRKGYRVKEEVLKSPRGTILWNQYISHSMSKAKWHELPCRFSDLDTDPHLRRITKWTLERLHRDLVLVGGRDHFALQLASVATQLIQELHDVKSLMPRRQELSLFLGGERFMNEALFRGIEAIAWIVDERGLGGGRELDGLAWQLPLDRLWESYVETVIRKEKAIEGGDVKVARLNETVFPLHWSDPAHRSLGHLVPDIVVRRGRSVHVIDAKYKAHLCEIDEAGWYRFTEDAKEAHRADLHQILAYSSLYDAQEITATLIYPLRRATWESLKSARRDISYAELLHGGRQIHLELRGMPFGEFPI